MTVQCNYFKVYLFTLKDRAREREREREISYLLIHFHVFLQ